MFGLLFLAAMIGATPATSDAQATKRLPVRENVSEYRFENGIMTLKLNDPNLYVLLGSGFLRPTTFGDPKAFVSDWLKLHPKAIVTPISRLISTNTRTRQVLTIVYVWIEEGDNSLNVDLVRAGVFAGGTMYDMVDNQKGLDQLLKSDPSLADARAQIEKERAAAPQDRSERLIPDADYKRRITRINEAEQAARTKKLGIWSAAMKEEREADGVQ